MNNEDKNEEKTKSGKATLFIALAAIAVSIAVIVYYLFLYSDTVKELLHITAANYIDITDEQLGSAKRLSGKAVYVTLFVSDADSRWDFSKEEDAALRKDIFGYCHTAADWIEEQAQRYSENVEFVTPQDENAPLLYYEPEYDFSVEEGSPQRRITRTGGVLWDHIEDNIDEEDIRNTYGCDSIVYLFFYNNEPDSEYNNSYAMCVTNIITDKMYEYCVLFRNDKGGNVLSPSVIAHETLHCFGAPDLYGVEGWRVCYGVGENMVAYTREHDPYDIMFEGYDLSGNNTIIQQVGDITAYYLDWLKDEKKKAEIIELIRKDDAFRSQFDRK